MLAEFTRILQYFVGNFVNWCYNESVSKDAGLEIRKTVYQLKSRSDPISTLTYKTNSIRLSFLAEYSWDNEQMKATLGD